MFTVHFFEISIDFVLKLYSLNIKKQIENRIESRACESKSNRIGTSESIPSSRRYTFATSVGHEEKVM